MAALTVPEDEMWVNLSPYEKGRIIPSGLGDTLMGRDLLAQDYVLKQFTASLMNPEDELGSNFWNRIYKKAHEKFGGFDVPVNTFNKVWIVPDKAVIYQNGTSVFVTESHFKVMLEEDYLALEENTGNIKHGLGDAKKSDLTTISEVSSEIIREIIIPEIEREVNEGKNFANLRQIANSSILATWYKENIQQSFLHQMYVDKSKTSGVDTNDKQINLKIYEQYVESFKKGVYSFIKEEYDISTQETILRKYFSGGVEIVHELTVAPENDRAVVGQQLKGGLNYRTRLGNVNGSAASPLIFDETVSLDGEVTEDDIRDIRELREALSVKSSDVEDQRLILLGRVERKLNQGLDELVKQGILSDDDSTAVNNNSSRWVLSDALSHITINAIDAIYQEFDSKIEQGKINIRMQVVQKELRIEIIDNGTGIDLDEIDSLGTLKISSKKKAKNKKGGYRFFGEKGFGLYWVGKVYDLAGWQLSATNRLDNKRGAIITSVLPIESDSLDVVGEPNMSGSSPLNAPGGIDLNPNIYDIETRGVKTDFDFQWNNQSTINLETDGLIPIILNVTPISSIPFLIGESSEEPPNINLSKTN